MKPTQQWMARTFKQLNASLFGNRLGVPNFNIEKLNGEWGRYDLDARFNRITRNVYDIPDNGTITLAGNFDRPEKNLANTLLHEMIHQYVYTIVKKFPIDEHGGEFQRIAANCNKQGWNINAKNEITPDDIEDGRQQVANGQGQQQTANPQNQQQNQAPKASYLCRINKYNKGAKYLYWICRADETTLSQTIDAFYNGPDVFYSMAVYNFKNETFMRLQMNPSVLYGFPIEKDLFKELSTMLNQKITKEDLEDIVDIYYK